MIRMLASVTDSAEAEMAIGAGAGIIDLKNPALGALGALPLERIRDILAQVAGRRPVSATIGDLPPDARLTDRAIRATAATGVDYVKVGFFTDAHVRDCLPSIAAAASSCSIVAVMFADRGPDPTRLADFAAAGCVGIMLDTAEKSGKGLLHHMTIAVLQDFVSGARDLGLLTGLAGSLRLEDIPQLRTLRPDYLGFRGALCQADRRVAGLDTERLRAVHAAVQANEA
ncbi:(5-formylfuran-3-yl)methyl phosphate synthase [Thiocapsa rosea]|nr:(5-formylfuran-3-yl)methyl phosphate synthase [Thiocapsa rosea]